MNTDEKTRKQKFIELVAGGEKPYRAAIKAGYSEQYAKVFSGKLLEKYKKEIEELKPIARQAIQEEFKYTVIESFKKFQEIQELALLPDAKGNYCNLTAAAKCEELKGRLYGVYEKDNTQKVTPELNITFVTKDEE